jgi:calcium-dependent protein kinase
LKIDEIWKTVSPECRALLKEMLTLEPEKRISASHALQRPFINKSNGDTQVTDTDLRLSVNNLRNFRTQTLFQKAVLTYFASQQLTQKEEAKIRKLFERFDVNKDGQLTRDELEKGYAKAFGDVKKAKKEVDRILRNIDFNNSGAIDYNGI